MPFLVVEVRTLALTTGTWSGACRVVCRHIGADLTASEVGKFVAPVLGPGTVKKALWHGVVATPLSTRQSAEEGYVNGQMSITGILLLR